jgi:gliding motility-associated-like protein
MSQSQACPENINFNMNALTDWDAYTGNNHAGNGPSAIKERYDRAVRAPGGTIGATTIYEYGLAVAGIQINTQNGIDPFGGFQTIPNINGYQYTNSVKLGSTSVSQNSTSNGGAPGGYIRGISYDINVPTSATNEPYTMTYAYAMVLENGTHNTIEQPLFSATLSTNDSVVSCASPRYNLPTNNNAQEGGRGATLDSAAAKAEGFTVSSKLSPTTSQVGASGTSVHLQDVWTKGWTEVTFDLSPYRGKMVTLTFEADNCIPGGHFAYAYIALRNNCAGLSISGEPIACTNTNLTYSIPALTGAKYEWIIPSGWTITSATDTSVVHVNIGDQPGYLIAHEINGCADLRDTLFVNTDPPTIPGNLAGDTIVCSGNNINPLVLSGNRGSVLKWIQSSDGTNWSDITDTTLIYDATNLQTTTTFRALVRNGPTCRIDTSTAATISVDPRSNGGELDPANKNICKGQDPGALLTLKGSMGAIQLWQSSTDSINWSTYFAAGTDSAYRVAGLTATTDYRVVVKSGVCPPDTSSLASIKLFDAFFPEANLEPADTTICYGTKASLDASIIIGTNYTWNTYENLTGPSSGNITAPYNLTSQATPAQTTDYVLTVTNANCPNPLVDTFHVAVLAPIIVSAGNDTSVVVNQPLQLHATSSDSGDTFVWYPALGLSNPNISNPTATYDAGLDSVRYMVTATSSFGCQGSNDIVVKIFKTGPDIFVPNAFTPDRATNNVFRPIPVGISTLTYFRIYNRWGQLVFSTNRSGQGWNGAIDGKPQGPSSYVWMVQGVDYQGNTITKKGVMALIR